MRIGLTWAQAAALALLAACSGGPNDYPDEARAEFDQACPLADALCACTWEEVTKSVPYDEFKDALERFAKEGLMDPRISRARATCLERR
jgi:hypothetical protein